MNNDTLKSLGYLKKSLSMSNRAIANAIKRDPADDVSDKVQDLINDLITEIDKIEAQGNYVPVAPSLTVPSIVPSPVTIPNDGNGIDFLVP
jgi:hypothetical protein